MMNIGKMNRLAVLRRSDFGLVLDDGDGGEVLLPNSQLPDHWVQGEALEVFVYLDSQGRITATLLRPKAMVGEFALLVVKETTPVGAFLDWGLPKDLLVPFREQRMPMKPGLSYLVHVYLDRVSGRIVASSKLDKFLQDSRRFYRTNEAVDLIIWQRTDLGYKAIINNERWGMVFHNEIFQPLERGQRMTGYIKRVRPDGRIDLSLQQPGYGKVTGLTQVILNYLKEQGGAMPAADRIAPEEINRLFGVSKKTFKKAIGALYRKRLIEITENETKLL